MTLDELAKAAAMLDETAFTARYPKPALVFTATSAKEGEKLINTPSSGEKGMGQTANLRPTDSNEPFRPEKVRPAPAPPELQRAEVVFLEKTSRNPFAEMITVGRATNNDVCLPLTSVSKVHAYFTHGAADEWKLTDQRATNGTWVNDARLAAGSTASLGDGTRIAFGPEARARFFLPDGLFGFLALYRAGVAT